MRKACIALFLNWTFVGVMAQEIIDEPYVCPPCNRKCDAIEFHGPGICQHCNMKLIPKSERSKFPSVDRKKVGFYIQSGVEILDLAGPLEVFAYVGYEVFTISKTKDPIYAQGILTVTPDYDLGDAPQADMLVFLGGNAVLPAKDKELIEWVRSQNETKYFFSVCSGALILSEAGILDHKSATTFRFTLDRLEKNYPKVKVLRGVRYVDNGNVVTTAGVSAGIDGALHMVAKLEGLQAAAQAAFYMEYDKWIPNQGVVLLGDNPYEGMNDTAALREYVGTYSSKDGDLTLILDDDGKQMILRDGTKSYPVYYLGDDQFISSYGPHLISLHRDKDNQVSTLETTEFKHTYTK